MNRLLKSACLVVASGFFFAAGLHAQNYSPLDVEDVLEQMAVDDEEEQLPMENMFEALSDLRDHPLNINTVTKEQLEQLPFLSDLQIENILYYLYVTGGMKTLYELQLVEEMDRQTIQYLLPFVYLGEPEKSSGPSWREMLRYGKNEVVARMNIPLKSDMDFSSYVGRPLYHSVRYGFRYKDRLHFGLTAENDAGEPFFKAHNKKGYDYYSYYFFLKDFGDLKALALGKYRLSFGLGLVMNMDFGLGKTSTAASIGYRNNGIRKHSSTDEYNYLQGAAASYRLKKFLLTAFYSYKQQDASVDNGLITSVRKDGLHRTVSDVEKKNQFVSQAVGTNIKYISGNLQLGFTVVYNHFNKLFFPDMKPYTAFYPRRKDFYAFGADYKYRWRKMFFTGEVAMSQDKGVASLHVLRVNPSSGYQLVFSHRYYSKRYYSWFARSLSEGADVRNESGYYASFEAAPLRYWKFFAYADFFYFPWLRYGVDKPSSGFDGLLQATYSPKRSLSMFWRYQYEVKDKNSALHPGKVLPNAKHKARYQLGYALPRSLSFRTTLDFVSVRLQGEPASCGYMLSQQLSYRFQQVPFELSVHYSLFDTDDYASRLTIYERGMLYAFSFPSFHGKGVRASLHARYDFNKHFTAVVKTYRTHYRHPSVEAPYSTRSGIDCQLRVKF